MSASYDCKASKQPLIFLTPPCALQIGVPYHHWHFQTLFSTTMNLQVVYDVIVITFYKDLAKTNERY